ncbi:hypothetical protein BS50DRAFT_580082 [Corynespora cassiicola Philippines]|uniref:Transcription factor domain-containing protein n=1 Tax=Corynespora cassiicola Philippines TaxID=1448308 RepID=A0A2T2N1S1_CORCC|nr:hypothetical protein BS50DRAFT_580082 [Corynespora cassiicola Philippines]
MWLSQPKTQLNIRCLNLIGTLLLTEAYLGYDTAAEHHLGGLKKLLDFRQHQCFSVSVGYQGSSEESDLVDRYNILAQAITKAKSRLDCNRGSSKRQSLPPFHLSTKDDKMVESIRLMPFFFVSLNVENDKVVDITKPADELRFLMSLLNPLVTSTAQKRVSLSAGDVALIILNANSLHAESLFSVQHFLNKAQEADKLACTWRTIVAARYCFWYGVLGLSKLGSPIEVDLPSHLYTLLLEDVFSSTPAPTLNQRDPDIWIWIVFSAAIALKRFWQALRDCCGLRLVEELHGMIVTQIKAWERF